MRDRQGNAAESADRPRSCAAGGSAVGSGEAGHIPVLAREVIDVLAPQAGQVYVDLTAGLGGHARLIAPRLGATGTVVLFDMDPTNLVRAERNVREVFAGRLLAVHANFAHAPRVLEEHAIRADAVLADLGFASTQVEDPARGLSFQRDGPLDMRLDPSLARTAADLVRTLPEAELERVLREFGEEPGGAARRIARKLAAARLAAPITTTGQLAHLVREALGVPPSGYAGRIDPATRTFQALRIAVNSELDTLDALLCSVEREVCRARIEGAGGGWLAPGARVAVITFHSLEDRPVKQAFGRISGGIDEGHTPANDDRPTQSGSGAEERGEERLSSGANGRRGIRVELLTRRPIVPTADECRENPRARSAKLRVIRLAEMG